MQVWIFTHIAHIQREVHPCESRDGATAPRSDLGPDLAEKHHIPVYNAMILAATKLAGCRTVLSEGFRDGRPAHHRAPRPEPFPLIPLAARAAAMTATAPQA